jgi:hypothetical protein
MTRCQHEPVNLFDPPGDNIAAALIYAMWNGSKCVMCRKCSATGYWGGYGVKRRVRRWSWWAFCPGGCVRLRESRSTVRSVRLQDKRQGALISHEFAAAGRVPLSRSFEIGGAATSLPLANCRSP